jgi:hypothetical protein
MLAKQLTRRVFSTSSQNLHVIKQKVANVNVTPHNPEHRPG